MPLAESSKKLYLRNIEKIRDGVSPGTSGLGFLENSKEVIAFIEAEPISVNSKKARYIAIVSTLKSIIGDVGGTPLTAVLPNYYARMLHYRDRHNEWAAQQKLSPREEELFVEWPVIIAGGEKLSSDVSTLWDFQDYVVYCLYTMIPPLRLDFSPMQVVPSVQDVSGNHNALIWDNNPRFYLQQYKTVSKYGKIFIDISPELKNVLSQWLEMQQSGWLLMNYGGTEPMNEQGLANRVKDVFQKATGKALGVSMLRHSFITYQRRGEMPFIESQRMAASMCHSSAMAQMYRRI